MSRPIDVLPMSRFRMVFVSGVLCAIVAGHLFDAWRQQDHWPFAAYPMFAGVNRPGPFTSEELWGVTTDGREVRVTNNQIGVLHLNRVRPSLMRIYVYSRRPNSPNPRGPEIALDGLLDYYEARRQRKQHNGPPLVAMRYYRLKWEFDWWARNRDAPQRTVLVRTSGDAPATTRPTSQPSSAPATPVQVKVMS